MGSYLGSHMGSNSIISPSFPWTISEVTYTKIFSILNIIQESSMLKVGTPCLGITSKHRVKKKKKILPDRFLQCKLNKKMPDLELHVLFVVLSVLVDQKRKHCYMQPLRLPSMPIFMHPAICCNWNLSESFINKTPDLTYQP